MPVRSTTSASRSSSRRSNASSIARSARARAPGEPAAEVPASPVGSLIGRTAPMLEVYKQIAHAADSSAPVLIVGESGVGQGTRGPGHSRPQQACARAVCGHQLRRDCRHAARVGALRTLSAGRSPARSPITKACSSRPAAARCCWTRSATRRRRCRSGCCGCSRNARSGRSAARDRFACPRA